MASGLKERLKARARDIGFDAAAIAPAELAGEIGDKLEAFLEFGRHGDMEWMVAKADRRRSPTGLWPEARSALVVAMNYGSELDPLARLDAPATGVVSVYAVRRDYHDVMKSKLKQLARWVAHEAGAGVKVFVDTAPLMEKPLAERAGLGWQGKHTNLVSREFGSWLFLGVLLTDLVLEPDAAEADHCGGCRACLDICPTQAFPAPYQLDARRCISYLTIEHKGHIAREFRSSMGNRIYGCDDCLAVCPWNKFAKLASEARLAVEDRLAAASLGALAELDDAGFRALFQGTPVKRTGRDRLVRNVLIAIGNSGDRAFVPVVRRHLSDASELVRAMAVWALSQLGDGDEIAALEARHLPGETDPAVRAEWLAAR
ncbi:MAG TPA: tRNA epoxyqueuosine(34) reductase QueG [Aestuariivirgaceae bacterium]|nr:tRNA epoxyqueuosine(34) reductase QueG [Aestuariivirgaceae bacterium]